MTRLISALNRRLREWLLRMGCSPRTFWDLWARGFRREPYQQAILPQHEWLHDIVLASDASAILEVGCGFGRNISWVQQVSPGAGIVVGADFSFSMLRQARRCLGQAAQELVQADAQRLPFMDRSFDLVFTMGLLMHVAAPAAAIAELIRVCRSELVLIEEWYPDFRGSVNAYTYVHDYDTLLKKAGAAVVSRTTVKNIENLLCIRAAPPTGRKHG